MRRITHPLLALPLLLPAWLALPGQDGPPDLGDLPQDRGPDRPGQVEPERPLSASHRRLTEEVGTWDALIRSYPSPGMPPSTSRGVETARLLGEHWLVKDFTAQLDGAPYEAHGQVGFDEASGRAVGTWIVAGEEQLRRLEGTYDLERRERVLEYSLEDADGVQRRYRETSRVLTAETRTLEVVELGEGGAELILMQADLTLRSR